MNVWERTYCRWYNFSKKRSFFEAGKGLRFYPGLSINRHADIKLGTRVRLYGGSIKIDSRIARAGQPLITIDDEVYLAPGYMIFLGAVGPEIRPELHIGKRVSISPSVRIEVRSGVTVEDDAMIGEYTYISDSGHEYRDPTVPIAHQGMQNGEPVRICKGAWIGTNVCIFKGVTIGQNSVIGANAVVTRDIPPYSVAAGVPARVIKRYDFEAGKWVGVARGESL